MHRFWHFFSLHEEPCADPESVVRGGPTLIFFYFFFSWWGEWGSNSGQVWLRTPIFLWFFKWGPDPLPPSGSTHENNDQGTFCETSTEFKGKMNTCIETTTTKTTTTTTTRVNPVFFNQDDYFLLKAELIMQNYFYKNIKLISKDRKNGLPKNCD